MSVNKSSSFFLGLVSGAVIGAGFFLLNLDELLTKKTSGNLSQQPETIPTSPIEELKQTATTTNTENANKTMNTAIQLSSDRLSGMPLTNIMNESDSLLKQSFETKTMPAGEENIVIRKDQLLSTQIIKIESSEKKEETTAVDTLLEKISGIKNTEPANSFRRTEFWDSPISYRGYKQTHSKLILFGIDPDLEVKLYNLNKRIYMKYDMGVYELDYTEEFKQFERVSDSLLIVPKK